MRLIIYRAMKRTGMMVLLLAAALLSACGASDDAAVQLLESAQMVAQTTAAAVPEHTPVETTQPEQTAEPMESPEPIPVFVGAVVCIADEYVNIREGAGTDTAVTGTLPVGARADVISYEQQWVHISYGGVTGYVSRDYTVSTRQPTADVPMGDWAAILVSPAYYLPDGFEVALADFAGGQVDARILEMCEQMFADAEADGVTLKLVDAYRSFDLQNELYQKKVDSYVAKGYSRADAEVKAATITARPNTSEHQTGLALDIVTPAYTRRDKGFAKTRAFKWLDINAHNYGFTLRYKRDKTEFTKVIYEPWHWRFVGAQAALDMKESSDCLEEYFGMMD